MSVPRLRIFAGPNGSGKSTLAKRLLPLFPDSAHVNADELEVEFKAFLELDMEHFGIAWDHLELRHFLHHFSQVQSHRYTKLIDGFEKSGSKLRAKSTEGFDSYMAAAIAAYIRSKLIHTSMSMSFETVMSHESKIQFMQEAKSLGYRVYLYYVAVESPVICKARILNRVRLGGHDVPEVKVVDRYRRSLDLLLPAISITNRAFIFNNSSPLQAISWVAEIADGAEITFASTSIPAWFKTAVLDRTG